MLWQKFISVTLLTSAVMAQSCGPNHPCTQGCCSTSGYCGFGPSFCGQGNCTSTCDAKAQCGQYAPVGKEKCLLNVCCSQYGYCGTTTDFCGTGCQNGCSISAPPSCSGGSSSQRRIAYYESWAYKRGCDGMAPELINVRTYTHINYAFALIGNDGRIAPMNDFDADLYPRVIGLKEQQVGLQVFISVGGWSAGGQVFSNMVANALSRATFIDSAVQFMRTYGFDGIDIDWEYPAARDQNGVAADTQNYVLLLKELRAAMGKLGLTATIPASYWYLQGFDIGAMQPHVDWFNVMTYDLHGTWDGTSPYTQAVVQSHSNLTEITQSLNLLWRNRISPNKVVLGLAFYGRSFTLRDVSCYTPGCAFTGGGDPGKCTQTSGFLSNAEIARVIKDNNLTPVFDKTAAIKYITWGNDQWVSYDDDETIALKNDYANSLCLGGTMVWAVDLGDPVDDDSNVDLIIRGIAKIDGKQALANKPYAMAKYAAIKRQNSVGLYTFWTGCALHPTCPPGFKFFTSGKGRLYMPGDPVESELSQECIGAPLGYSRALCVDNSVAGFDCKWYSTAKSCSQFCPANTILLAFNSQPGGARMACSAGKYAAYCCSGLQSDAEVKQCPASMPEEQLNGVLPRFQYKERHLDRPNDPGSYGITIECKADDPSYHQYLSSFDGTMNIVPGNWHVGPDGYSAYKQPFVKEYYPPKQAASSVKAPCDVNLPPVTQEVDITGALHTRTCDYNRYPQACHHYSSLSRVAGSQTMTCPRSEPTVYRTIVEACDRQHHSPQSLRRVPNSWDKGAGLLWANDCKNVKSSTVTHTVIVDRTCYTTEHVTYTLPRFSMTFVNTQNENNDGIRTNWCQITTYNPGFQLLTCDAGTRTHSARSTGYSKSIIPDSVTHGLGVPHAYRKNAECWDKLFLNELAFDNGNRSTARTEAQLWDESGIKLCRSEDCVDELEELGISTTSAEDTDKAAMILPTRTEPVLATPTATPAAAITGTAERPSMQTTRRPT